MRRPRSSPPKAPRWAGGHPWIFRSDLITAPTTDAGAVTVLDNRRRKPIGIALWSPRSEISLRLLDRDPDAIIDEQWWHDRIERAIATARAARTPTRTRTGSCTAKATRCRRSSAIATTDGSSSSCSARASSGIATTSSPHCSTLTGAEGILARNDPPVRAREGLPRETTLLTATCRDEIEVHEHGVRYLAAPWTGQKTGAFLDQREARAPDRRLRARARARLLQLPRLVRAAPRAKRRSRHRHRQLRRRPRARGGERAPQRARERSSSSRRTRSTTSATGSASARRFDTIVLDPPAFAKTRPALTSALRGYKEINLRAMRLLAPGGMLYTASCSYHLTKPLFLEMIERAAADSGRRLALREMHRPTTRSPGDPHDPRDGVHQGRHPRSNGLMPRLGVRYHGLTTLTMRAEVRRAAALHDATNAVAAPRARQPFPIVHLESANTVVAIAPARPLRLVEHRPNGLEQTNADARRSTRMRPPAG